MAGEMNAEEICNAAGARTISEGEAVRRLVGLGFYEQDAREQVYIAMGGDDVVL